MVAITSASGRSVRRRRRCFGSDESPSERPVPQVSIEFEVDSANAVTDAAAELCGRGSELLHNAREEAWDQTVARLPSSEGAAKARGDPVPTLA